MRNVSLYNDSWDLLANCSDVNTTLTTRNISSFGLYDEGNTNIGNYYEIRIWNGTIEDYPKDIPPNITNYFPENDTKENVVNILNFTLDKDGGNVSVVNYDDTNPLNVTWIYDSGNTTQFNLKAYNESNTSQELNLSDGTYQYNVSAWGSDLVNETHYYMFLVGVYNCQYGGSGNWIITAYDRCTFVIPTIIDGNFTATRKGILNLNTTFTFNETNRYIIFNSGVTLNINSGGGFE
jgi:hypothetical protein